VTPAHLTCACKPWLQANFGRTRWRLTSGVLPHRRLASDQRCSAASRSASRPATDATAAHGADTAPADVQKAAGEDARLTAAERNGGQGNGSTAGTNGNHASRRAAAGSRPYPQGASGRASAPQQPWAGADDSTSSSPQTTSETALASPPDTSAAAVDARAQQRAPLPPDKQQPLVAEARSPAGDDADGDSDSEGTVSRRPPSSPPAQCRRCRCSSRAAPLCNMGQTVIIDYGCQHGVALNKQVRVQRRRRPAVEVPEGQRRTVRMVRGLPRRRRAVPAICARCGGSGIAQQGDVSAGRTTCKHRFVAHVARSQHALSKRAADPPVADQPVVLHDVQGKMAPCPICKPMQAQAQQRQAAQQQPLRQEQQGALTEGNVPEFDLENVDWDALEKLAVEVGALLPPAGVLQMRKPWKRAKVLRLYELV
jgi:hypothetical protein